jgi:hypothetical protein
MSQLNYEELTKGLTTKSEKIRVLGRKGVPTAEIARFLEIRYQHARNVLVDAGLQHGGMAEEMPVLETKMMPPVDSGSFVRQSVWVDVDTQGRLQIPADLLALVGVTGQDRLFIKPTERGFEVLTRNGAMARMKEISAPLVRPGVSLVDEFLAEKRLEVAADEAKWKRLEAEAAEAAKEKAKKHG